MKSVSNFLHLEKGWSSLRCHKREERKVLRKRPFCRRTDRMLTVPWGGLRSGKKKTFRRRRGNASLTRAWKDAEKGARSGLRRGIGQGTFAMYYSKRPHHIQLIGRDACDLSEREGTKNQKGERKHNSGDGTRPVARWFN